MIGKTVKDAPELRRSGGTAGYVAPTTHSFRDKISMALRLPLHTEDIFALQNDENDHFRQKAPDGIVTSAPFGGIRN